MTNRDEADTVFKQRPRVTLQIPTRTYEIEAHQPSPFIPLTGASSIPNVEANPFLQALYAQKAGDFMSKQFEGLNRFTKSGLSVGEKSVVWLYTKFRKLSKKWFTHIFLFLVVTLYSIAGAFLFMAIEGPPETQFFEDVRKGRMKLSSTARNLSANVELLQDDLRWEGEFTRELYEYEMILYKAFEKGQYDNAELKKTWTFFNAIFYCGTIYTTIEKSMAQSAHRSQSTSRQSASCQTNNDIFTYLRRAKRSLSAPRKREGSVESVKLTPQMQEMKISILEKENYELSNKSNDNDEKNVLLEQNLRRFEEERRQFEMEKLKFLEDKRELDRLRLQRFERYKRELEAKRLGLKPNYDIDNPNDYMVARKIVIDYKVNENLHSQHAQESGSESEQEITVVENLPKALKINVSKECVNNDKEIECKNDEDDNAIKECSNNHQKIIQSHLNGKEMLNDVEKSNDQIGPEVDTKNIDNKEYEKIDFDGKNPIRFWPFCKILYNECRHIWKDHKQLHSTEWHRLLFELKKCISELLLLMIFCGMGGVILHYIEGNFEMLNKTGVKRVKRDFIDQLWLSSHNLREEDWKSVARTRLRKFEEELQSAIEGGMNTYSGHTTWNFVNAVLYCFDISTTIGYGHISPRTVSGRIVTIVYAIIGIPIFLILLADFGKLFTRIIKFLWVFVRRLYYTGSCRKVRKTAPAQDVMRGLNAMYDIMRRPSIAFDPNILRTLQQQQQQTENSRGGPPGESPMTPLPDNLKNYEIDDEFNLPISVAIIMLVGYMIFGATFFCILEDDWTFFESFYFVFISISTIGFGDFVPSHPLYMMVSILYLIFGLALTSMCINVVQLKLSEHFKQASSKIIGFHFAEAASQGSVPQSAELQSVQSTNLNENSQPTNVIIADKNTNSTML